MCVSQCHPRSEEWNIMLQTKQVYVLFCFGNLVDWVLVFFYCSVVICNDDSKLDIIIEVQINNLLIQKMKIIMILMWPQ